MTPLDIDHLEELLAKATPGEWYELDHHVSGGPESTHVCEVSGSLGNPQVRADRALIVALRNAAPELLRLAREHATLSARVENAETAAKEIIAVVEADERYYYKSALVQFNAPLALIQVELGASRRTAQRILAAIDKETK